jgi:hypothetical protein
VTRNTARDFDSPPQRISPTSTCKSRSGSPSRLNVTGPIVAAARLGPIVKTQLQIQKPYTRCWPVASSGQRRPAWPDFPILQTPGAAALRKLQRNGV